MINPFDQGCQKRTLWCFTLSNARKFYLSGDPDDFTLVKKSSWIWKVLGGWLVAHDTFLHYLIFTPWPHNKCFYYYKFFVANRHFQNSVSNRGWQCYSLPTSLASYCSCSLKQIREMSIWCKYNSTTLLLQHYCTYKQTNS